MRFFDINAEHVESFLRALRSGSPGGNVLLEVDEFFDPGIDTPEQRSVILSDRLEQVIRKNYLDSRRHEGLSENLAEIKIEAFRQIAEDYARGNADLEAWSVLYYRYIATINASVDDLARAANVVPQQLRRRLNLGLALLLRTLQQKALTSNPPFSEGKRHLPLPETIKVVGIAVFLNQLKSLYSDPDGPRMVSLEGIGGIGKTALARTFVALPEVALSWPTILWVSARQTSLTDDGRVIPADDPAMTLEDISLRLAEQLNLFNLQGKTVVERLDGLAIALTNKRALVVIDNLETVNEYKQLIPALAKLAGSSRFLVTTRQTLRSFPYVRVIPLNEMTREVAFDFLKSELERRGRSSTIDLEQFSQLYETIGGIPLALKLAASQLTLHPLQELIESIRGACHGIDGLFHFLYRQTWQNLSDSGRRLLLTFLPANPEGEDLDYLLTMSGLSGDQFYSALQELDQFSLLEVGGDIVRPLYRLHRLTVTFLQTDILKRW